MASQWTINRPDIETTRQICRRTGCHPVIATILANRGFTAGSDLDVFLNPSLKDLRFTDSFADMEATVCRIEQAIIEHEKILIFGDYDVDGITSSVILLEFLKYAGADVEYYIPHRIDEGYGLNSDQITGYAIPRGIDLIITVDCGSSSHDAIRRARDSGIDVIITDHHAVPGSIPEAFAVVNPQRQDCPSGFRFLAGVGVVFYLLIHLRKRLRDTGFWDRSEEPNLREFCDLVALGTVSDIVPLIRENRIITRTGIQVINAGLRPGIKALVECCSLGKPIVDAQDISYRLGPRLNAAGRMDHAKLAVNLLMASDIDQARALAAEINVLNSRRQTIENQIFTRTLMYLKEEPEVLKGRTLVLGNSDYHEGVLGIVASKLAEKFCRPVVLISFKDRMGKGSARSIPGVNLYEAISACSDFLEKFGGHPMAAGLTVKPENFKSFRQAFEETVQAMTVAETFAGGPLIDCELELGMISEDLIDQIENLQPFGPQNPEPLFLSKNIEVVFSKTLKEKHQRLVLKQGRFGMEKKIGAMWFNAENDTREKKFLKRIAYTIRRDRFNGGKTAQIIIEKAE